ncbi:MAG: insulinase family protein [Deltaproteobacteria bacterium]|nr:insulinase family protein [Deltaproteobacteria bacterium]
MVRVPMSDPTERLQRALERLNHGRPARRRVALLEPFAFGPHRVEHLRLGNGLRVLCLVDPTAPVVSYNTWFRVGSRDEVEGKTGLAHLFEHLMFNETRDLPAGRFDQLLERAGAETNASTWYDWTHYYANVPRDQLPLVVRLEAGRMAGLVLREKPVASEKEVVANERRYSVDDDPDGTVNEALWANAFTVHPYHHSTIGWMKDILAFTVDDCRRFYRAFYAPDNATVVLSGDLDLARAVTLLDRHYGPLKASGVRPRALPEEPTQTEERALTLTLPTPSARVAVGYKSPPYGHPDHPALTVLCEALTGGRSARLYHRLVTVRELASDVGAWASTFCDPGLLEFNLTARDGGASEALLAALDQELDGLEREPLTADEVERAVARIELGFYRSLETASGRAEIAGFADTVAGSPTAAWERLRALTSITAPRLQEAARAYLLRERRTVVHVRPNLAKVAS